MSLSTSMSPCTWSGTISPSSRPTLLDASSAGTRYFLKRKRGHGRKASTKPCRANTFKVAMPCATIQDAGAALLVMGGATFLVRSFDVLAERNIIDQKLSRKAVHILSGVLYMTSWPMFSMSSQARFFAASVPLLNCIRLVLNGLSLANNEGLVASLTREGKREELLKGPLYYVLVLLICVLVFWRDSPVGIVSLAMMCGGDGFADIVGRRFGGVKLPYNDRKSWAGSISMFLSGLFVSMVMLYYYSCLGFIEFDWWLTVEKVALVSLIATVVESLPVTDVVDDNIAVPFTSISVALVLFQGSLQQLS